MPSTILEEDGREEGSAEASAEGGCQFVNCSHGFYHIRNRTLRFEGMTPALY